MKGISVEKLVYDQLFPKARPNDPQNFQAFCSRCIIGEVRSETQAFYGHLDTQEAKFPGLDYTNPTHRIRLGRFTWHRRLFRAFDALGLTPGEIANLTRWEGTKWAKDKYEKEHGIVIRDTTSDGIAIWDDEIGAAVPDPKYQVPDLEDDDDDQPITREQVRVQVQVRGDEQENPEEEEDEEEEEEEEEVEEEQPARNPTRQQQQQHPEEEEEEDEDEASEPELESVGVALNRRLREGAARREAGDTTAVLDEEWEQWLKHIIDSGLLNENMEEDLFRSIFDATIVPAGMVPADVMSAARAGRWSEVPEFMHNILRRSLQPGGRRQRGAPLPMPRRQVRVADIGPALIRIQNAHLGAEALTSPLMTETPGA